MSDVDAFVREHQEPVWRYLRLLGAAPHDADDLLQETLVRFLSRPRPEGEPTGLLRAIARGLWIDRQRWWRRRRLVQWADELDQELASAPGSDDPDLWLDALASCREKLTERARRALDLAYRDGRSRRDTAQQLGVSPNTARNLLASTRATLRACIEARLADDTNRGTQR